MAEPATYNEVLSKCSTVWPKASAEDHMQRVAAQGDLRPMAASTEAMAELKTILAGRAAFDSKASLQLDNCAQPLAETYIALRSLVRTLLHCCVVKIASNPPPPFRSPPMTSPARVDYQTHPSQYKHWKLKFEGQVATLSADFDENAGRRPGYKLKLNSHDLGVDVELNDAINHVRFEHLEVRTVVRTSAKEKVFCSGANMFMLGVSSHAWKVNVRKFTNETRNGLEDSSAHGGLKFLAVNGACAGGGYEVTLACDEIILVDDRASAVSLPEVSLLGVLPGTGGPTRVTVKRHVRHDLADLFCTSVEGVRGQKAKDWRLVGDIARPAQFAARAQARALELATQSDRPANAQDVALPHVQRTIEPDAIRYSHVSVEIDRSKRVATWTIQAPSGAQPNMAAAIEAAGAGWYPLVLARELGDANLEMRTNELDIGTWLMKSQGSGQSARRRRDRFAHPPALHQLPPQRDHRPLWRQ